MIKLIEPPEIKLKRTVHDEDGWIIYCPGCKHYHKFRFGWHFDGNTEYPTFSPSLVIKLTNKKEVICHSFVRNGSIEFLNDSKHKLAGYTVELPILDNNGRILNMKDMPKKTIRMIEPEVKGKSIKEDIIPEKIIPEKSIKEAIIPEKIITEIPEIKDAPITENNDVAVLIGIVIVGVIIFGILAFWL